MTMPYSESCDQNKDPILSVISPLFISCSRVLEVGSGTGQHAIYFAKNMPHLTWYTSDRASFLSGIRMRLEETVLPNVISPLELDVTTSTWPELEVDAIFTANTLHIMHHDDVVNFISGASRLLKPEGSLVIYGPFNYGGLYTSESNECFDKRLVNNDPLSGIKHFEEIKLLAEKNDMQLITDYEMPANNRILHFMKI